MCHAFAIVVKDDEFSAGAERKTRLEGNAILIENFLEYAPTPIRQPPTGRGGGHDGEPGGAKPVTEETKNRDNGRRTGTIRIRRSCRF